MMEGKKEAGEGEVTNSDANPHPQIGSVDLIPSLFPPGEGRVKNASNKLSLSAPPVFQRLLHPRRFRVMREK